MLESESEAPPFCRGKWCQGLKLARSLFMWFDVGSLTDLGLCHKSFREDFKGKGNSGSIKGFLGLNVISAVWLDPPSSNIFKIYHRLFPINLNRLTKITRGATLIPHAFLCCLPSRTFLFLWSFLIQHTNLSRWGNPFDLSPSQYATQQDVARPTIYIYLLIFVCHSASI